MDKQLFQNQKHKFLVHKDDEFIPVNLNDIVYVSPEDRTSSVHLENGEKIKSDKPLHYIKDQLEKYPNFKKCHRSYIVNLDKIVSYEKIRNSVFLFFKIKNKKIKIPTTRYYSKKIRNYLGVPTLKHIFPYNRQEKILKKERIKNYDKDLRFMSKKELLKEFGAYSSGRIIKPVYIKNVIWQLYTWIKQGKAYPVEGNIRTLWYSHIKPVFSRLGILNSGDDSIINTVLVELTYKYDLFDYADLGLADENRHNWKIGNENPHVIIFAEKEGFLNTLEKINNQTGVSIIALGGQPSHLTTEYFATELLKKIDSSSFIIPEKEIDFYDDPTFYIFSVVDWDPSGYHIKQSFIEQLQAQGLEKIKTFDLIHPKHFKSKQIKFIKYKLKSTLREKTKNQNWIRETGGVNGESYGIEADAMPRVKTRKLFIEKAKKYFRKTPSSTVAFLNDKNVKKQINEFEKIYKINNNFYV
jgi:hypothetical protein